eukprot:CAMPEP_0172661392 /NCGR_PEP_ID=MMETSP1074-20121228/4670_1 /TAXON_ID=2916 /ORGANISM="Ceratium fusus, Strain PA161109" /LENGTH=447 /DNA_ID=CAMNT_0013477149 /DNA_START=22 /DNA_END=1365 /DNA_ORIENTATION=-
MAVVNIGLARATQLVQVDAKKLLASEAPAVDPLAGSDAVLEQRLSFVVSVDPKIAVVPDFLTAAECDHLVHLVQGAWRPSRVSTLSLQEKVSNGRTSWSCETRYSQTSVLERLEHRLAGLAGLPVSQIQKLHLVRYAPCEHFEEHHDGQGRPKSIFVYLNDLSEHDTGGHTFFPVLGLSFKPCRGTAVVWANTTPEGEVDSRMVHVGQAPTCSVKYGLNCFFDHEEVRKFILVAPSFCLKDARVVSAMDLPEQGSMVCDEPRVIAVPSFLNQSEVAHILEQMTHHAGQDSLSNSFFPGVTEVIHVLEMEGTKTIATVEARMSTLAHLPVDHLSKLRIVQPGTKQGLCDRGFGCIGFYVSLSECDDVFFPALGVRVVLRSGDAIIWHNGKMVEHCAHEDLRSLRFHLGKLVLRGLDASFHAAPIRHAFQLRTDIPVTDSSVAEGGTMI